jgi:hypothetical protein
MRQIAQDYDETDDDAFYQAWQRSLGNLLWLQVGGRPSAAPALPDFMEQEDLDTQIELLVWNVAQAQADAGQTEAAKTTLSLAHKTAQGLVDGVYSREFWLVEIAKLQSHIGNPAAALEIVEEIRDEERRADVFAAIGVAQARAGYGQDVINTVDKIFIDRNKHIASIAGALAEAGDREHLKRLLTPCAYYLDTAHQICGLLARVYLEDAEAIARAVHDAA